MTNKKKQLLTGPFVKIFLSVIIFIITGCSSNNDNIIPENYSGARVHPMAGNTSVYDTYDTIQNEEEEKGMSAEEYELLGDSMMKRGKIYLAFIQYEKSLKKDPDNIRIEYKKGLALLIGEQYDEAINQFDRVIDKNDKHAFAYQGLGIAYYKKGDHVNSEMYLRKGLDINPTLWKSYNLLGNIYDKQEKHDVAIREYKRAISINPNGGYLFNNLGVSYTLCGKHEKAVRAFEKAIRKGYAKKRVYNNLAIALCNMGRYGQAFDVFKRSLGEAMAYNNLGCIYMEHGKLDKAKNCFEKAIESNPQYYSKANDNLKKVKADYYN